MKGDWSSASDEATHGDDRVGEVEEGVDHTFASFVAALQPVERVVSGIRALDVPAVGGLDPGPRQSAHVIL
jgi:hypothetical protein